MTPLEDRETVGLRFYGDGKGIPLDAFAKAMGAFDGLLREVSREAVGEEIGFNLTGLRFVCDWCDRQRPAEYAGWVNDSYFDYCPACAHELAMGAAL